MFLKMNALHYPYTPVPIELGLVRARIIPHKQPIPLLVMGMTIPFYFLFLVLFINLFIY